MLGKLTTANRNLTAPAQSLLCPAITSAVHIEQTLGDSNFMQKTREREWGLQTAVLLLPPAPPASSAPPIRTTPTLFAKCANLGCVLGLCQFCRRVLDGRLDLVQQRLVHVHNMLPKLGRVLPCWPVNERETL